MSLIDNTNNLTTKLAALWKKVKAKATAQGATVANTDSLTQMIDKMPNAIVNMNGATGHLDSVGLKAIGWTDDDIACFQKYGVDWDESDDSKYVVSDIDKQCYADGASKIANYQYILRWCPKFGSKISSFQGFGRLIGCTSTEYLFSGWNCPIKCITGDEPVIMSDQMAMNNTQLYRLPPCIIVDKNITNCFSYCYNLKQVNIINNQTIPINADNLFSRCYALAEIKCSNTIRATSVNGMFNGCKIYTPIILEEGNVTTHDVGGVFESTFFDVQDSDFSLATTSASAIGNIHGNVGIINLSNSTNYNWLISGDINSIDLIILNPNLASAPLGWGVLSYCTSWKFKNLTFPLPNLCTTNVLIDKAGLLYTIQNAVPKSAITITLNKISYSTYSVDTDILSALTVNPLVLLASA